MLRVLTFVISSIVFLTPCMAQERGTRAVNGDVEIAYWVQGPERGVPLVLVNGQGAATRVDYDGLVEGFVARGFRVITFDNRDSGRSTVFNAAGAPPNLQVISHALAAGSSPPVAYDLSDMAHDAIAVLDSAGIARAHFLGHSLGGMIAQVIAIEHPERVLSLVSASATSGEADLPFGPALTALSDPARQGVTGIAEQTQAYRIFEGNARYRMTDDEVAARVAADMLVDDPNAPARQGAAAMATGDRRVLLGKIARPSLVIHGGDDPWFPIDHARSTASALGSPIEVIDGMGHIIADTAAEILADRVSKFIRGLPAD